MNDEEIQNWYAERVPISGRLSDYSLLVGQNNRVTNNTFISCPAGSTVTQNRNINRVSLAVFALFTPGTTAAQAKLDWLDYSGAVVLSHTVYSKIADIALVTPSPYLYCPYKWVGTDFAQLVQLGYRLTSNDASVLLTAVETTFVPKCCEYISKQKEGSMEPQQFAYLADKQARRRNP